ncbi:MAG: hypothetical protein LBT62_07380 [Deltaproteobacteria bacterium]|jgi:hypothetical protein|nr:hypothetical protein [Deltaproteobacteria bacterium]
MKKFLPVISLTAAITIALTVTIAAAIVGVRPILAQPATPPPLPPTITLPSEEGVENILNVLLKIPYRADGVVSDDGRWTTWKQPQTTLESPGLNCSGFLLEAARLLLGRNITLQEASFDRDQDSGLDSPLGQDWDFGLDLLLNLAKVKQQELLPTPQEDKLDQSPSNRPMGLGIDINGDDFEPFLKQLPAPNVYLLVISKPERRLKSGLAYYHVGLLHVDLQGAIWLYQATPKAGAHRINIASKEGLSAIRRYFPPIKGTQRRMALARLETDPEKWGPPLDPWTAAGRLDPAATPIAVEGDGLGGNIIEDAPSFHHHSDTVAPTGQSEDELLPTLRVAPQNPAAAAIDTVEEDENEKIYSIKP